MEIETKIISSKTSKPSSTTRKPLPKYQLWFVDQVSPSFTTTIIYFYPSNPKIPNSQKTNTAQEILVGNHLTSHHQSRPSNPHQILPNQVESIQRSLNGHWCHLFLCSYIGIAGWRGVQVDHLHRASKFGGTPIFGRSNFF